MKNEQSLRKTPVEPLDTLPASQFDAAGMSGGAIGRTLQQRTTRAVPFRVASGAYADIPPSVYGTFIACWTAVLVVFWFTFAESPNAAFMVAISTAFAFMFFGVPITLYRVGYRRPVAGPSLGDFLRGHVQTLTGAVSGLDALVQITVVPVCLTIGAVAISLIIDLDRMAN